MMSYIFSKYEELNRLRFEPITAKVVAVEKMTTIGGTIVVLGKDGVIYTTGVSKGFGYSLSYEGRVARVIDGCVKLGVLSAEAVAEHKAIQKTKAEEQSRKWEARRLVEAAERLGLNLTAHQKKKLNPLVAKDVS